MKIGFKLNEVIFKTREGDKASLPNECAIGGKWVNKSTDDLFKGKRVVLFSLPGAFTPTCSSQQLPGFEENNERFKKLGVDAIYCCSVNDAYVMNAWSDKMKIKNVKFIPDGNGSFTKHMGMLISKEHNGFGNRSWRYMAVITDGIVEKWWEEPGINNDGEDDDPYGETMPEKCLEYLAGSE
ncbi:peroxiredoxin [Candidatus Pelagibacter sp.]|jgi:thioredoxin-dependent peroxiredoxin|nr:peroxiredoxin [Candidatus Pelagibacter sp.]